MITGTVYIIHLKITMTHILVNTMDIIITSLIMNTIITLTNMDTTILNMVNIMHKKEDLAIKVVFNKMLIIHIMVTIFMKMVLMLEEVMSSLMLESFYLFHKNLELSSLAVM